VPERRKFTVVRGGILDTQQTCKRFGLLRDDPSFELDRFVFWR
jgi:hypothetical protein